jgi:hypothetical protein
MSLRAAAKTYGVPESSLRFRMKACVANHKKRNAAHNPTESEEETFIHYILDLDSRGFPPRIEEVKNMADLLLIIRSVKHVDKQWAYRFIQRHPELKTRFSRTYDFQSAFYEDPNFINAWFQLVVNIHAKYEI